MEKDRLGNLLSDIIEDRRTGSTGIGFRVAEFYSQCVQCSEEFMARAHAAIDSAHIGMGIVRNVNNELFRIWKKNPDRLPDSSREITGRIKEQSRRSVENAAEILKGGVKVTTLSSSSAVREALISNRKEISSVYVLESRPGLEGKAFSRDLAQHGLKTVLLVDAAVQLAARGTDIVLCGSDSILSDGTLIHKIGTYPLFLAMEKEEKEAYSMSIGLKKEMQFTASSYPPFNLHDPSEISDKGTDALNVYYDMTSMDLITGYVTEAGIGYSSDF